MEYDVIHTAFGVISKTDITLRLRLDSVKIAIPIMRSNL
jgi:hypothetical protein